MIRSYATHPASPETDVDEEILRQLLPPYRVILLDDNLNTMEHVVQSLMTSVPSLNENEATAIMLEAHMNGRSTVIECPKEVAEHYWGALKSYGLMATIESV